MKMLLLIGIASIMTPTGTVMNGEQVVPSPTPSPQIDAPPSPAKLDLIRRFLRATGVQARIDSGNFLERHALPGGTMWPAAPDGQQHPDTLFGAIERRIAALHDAYARHRSDYQREYERHVDWEFTEDELREIVEFLERPVGRHYLDGSWRMNAYVGTNTEDIEEQIVQEAMAALAP